ncbi:zinc ribbon domain-containing protein [uncultured Gemmiger sp.]|uniref:zinc ribbon domain-containing protein n=1 Tax=uncultured Gemmiger sp. TaxID=1623490 RepID=UPI0025E7EF20|nr:zinc ribbon domain-containing protein [uncultured Gemmiger sp.]
MHCSNCGAELVPGNTFCPKCGSKVAQTAEPPHHEVRTFYPKATAGLLAKALTAGGAFAAVLSLIIFLVTADELNDEETMILLCLFVGCAAVAVVECISWLNTAKNRLVLGERTVSGSMSMGLRSVPFEYQYRDITEVTYALGIVGFRVNGRNIAVTGLENAEKAVEVLRSKTHPQ